MTPNIDHLTEAQLIDLNRRIVERLKFLAQMRAHASMLDFSVGDRVSFQPAGRPTQFGILTRYNKKTVTVITEDGLRWTVSPQLLRKVVDLTSAPTSRPLHPTQPAASTPNPPETLSLGLEQSVA